MKIKGEYLPKIKSLLVVLISVFIVSSAFAQDSRDQIADTDNYTNELGEDPQDYLISKFKNHDIILINEFNHFELQVNFLASMIPDLQYHGIHILAIDCGDSKYQKALDKLLTSNFFDEENAIRILTKSEIKNHSYRRDFVKLFKEAWRTNRLIPENGRKFSILLLNSSGDSLLDKARFAPSIIYKRAISKGEKILIYSSAIQSTNSKSEFTNFLKQTFSLVLIPDSEKVFSINFHVPWIVTDASAQNNTICKKPMSGIIEDYFSKLGNKSIGFDTKGSIFETLIVDPYYYNNMDTGCQLAEICDGYIILASHDKFKSFANIQPNGGN